MRSTTNGTARGNERRSVEGRQCRPVEEVVLRLETEVQWLRSLTPQAKSVKSQLRITLGGFSKGGWRFCAFLRGNLVRSDNNSPSFVQEVPRWKIGWSVTS